MPKLIFFQARRYIFEKQSACVSNKSQSSVRRKIRLDAKTSDRLNQTAVFGNIQRYGLKADFDPITGLEVVNREIVGHLKDELASAFERATGSNRHGGLKVTSHRLTTRLGDKIIMLRVHEFDYRRFTRAELTKVIGNLETH